MCQANNRMTFRRSAMNSPADDGAVRNIHAQASVHRAQSPAADEPWPGQSRHVFFIAPEKAHHTGVSSLSG